MDIKEIIGRNYYSAVRRGQITKDMTGADFAFKIAEELDELVESFTTDSTFDEKELADIALVCFSMAKHFKIDLLKVMEDKVIFNEQRKD